MATTTIMIGAAPPGRGGTAPWSRYPKAGANGASGCRPGGLEGKGCVTDGEVLGRGSSTLVSGTTLLELAAWVWVSYPHSPQKRSPAISSPPQRGQFIT